MAGLKDADDFRDGEHFKSAGLLKWICLFAGGLSLAVFLIVAFSTAKTGEMAYSYLFAIIFFLTLSIGGLFWTLLHHAANSGWGTVIRRQMENLGTMIPFVLLLALPLLIPGFRDALWEWFPEKAEAVHHAEELAAKGKDDYIKKKTALQAEAVAEVEKAKQEYASEGEGLLPGHRQYHLDKIAALEKKSSKLAEVDLSEEAVIAKLEAKHFKHENALLYSKSWYLDKGKWYLRYVVFFLVLTGIIFLLRRWSTTQDRTGDPKLFLKMRKWSCGFLLPFALAWTLLVVDWLMALDYAWFSTMWGVYLFAGAALNSMGLLVLLVTWLRRKGYLRNVVTMEHYHLMGKLMMAFTVFWAYIAFSQYFLIWYANITEETKFYLTRNSEFWNVYTIAFLVIGHFFIPFGALLLQQLKKVPAALCAVAVWNLVMHFLDLYWITIPERGVSLTKGKELVMKGAWVFDIWAFVSIGLIFAGLLLLIIGRKSLFPCRDPRLDESLNVLN